MVYNGTVSQSTDLTVTDDVFKRTQAFAFARATQIMNTKSPKDFEWSVKLIGNEHFHVGIATQFQNKSGHIAGYDKDVIFYSSDGKIRIGHEIKYIIEEKQESDDVINFRFQSRKKQLYIKIVST